MQRLHCLQNILKVVHLSEADQRNIWLTASNSEGEYEDLTFEQFKRLIFPENEEAGQEEHSTEDGPNTRGTTSRSPSRSRLLRSNSLTSVSTRGAAASSNRMARNSLDEDMGTEDRALWTPKAPELESNPSAAFENSRWFVNPTNPLFDDPLSRLPPTELPGTSKGVDTMHQEQDVDDHEEEEKTSPGLIQFPRTQDELENMKHKQATKPSTTPAEYISQMHVAGAKKAQTGEGREPGSPNSAKLQAAQSIEEFDEVQRQKYLEKNAEQWRAEELWRQPSQARRKPSKFKRIISSLRLPSFSCLHPGPKDATGKRYRFHR